MSNLKKPSKPGGLESVLVCLGRAKSEDDLTAQLASAARSATNSDACDILLAMHGRSLILTASTSLPEYTGRLRLGKGVGVVGYALQAGRPVSISKNLSQNKRNAKLSGFGEQDYESAYAVPLVHQGEPFGVLLLRRSKPWKPTTAERRHIAAIGAAMVQVICGFRQAHELGMKSSKLGALGELTRTANQNPYLEEILQLLVNLTAQRFNFRVVTVRLLDEKHQELILRATQAENKAYQRKRAIKVGESHAGRAIVENRPVLVEDVQVDQEYIGHELAEEQGLRSMICLPLTIQNRPVGVMTCYTSEPRTFATDEVAALETLAKQAAINIEHAKLQVRNTLMQEMHHRVKNNLQQVASLLRLQLRQSHYKSLEHAINDSLARILAIAAVHDLLSREDLDHVGVKDIAATLVHHQQQSFLSPAVRIQFSIRGDEVYLSTTQATQVALVLNELIQNAVEHGFAIKKEGQIHVNVEDNDGEIGLWVSDDGDPLPPGFDPKQGQLGLQIVDNLSRALGGSFVIEDRLGWTVCEVIFTRTGGE